jgi:hypothetical protein
MPVLICKDADASIYNVGYDQPWLPNFADALYAFYLLGTDAPLDVLRDYSGNDRNLARTGAPVEGAASSAIGAFPAGYIAPFSGDDLFAASGNTGFTILAVARTSADAVAAIVGGSDAVTTKHVGLLTTAGSDVQAAVRNGGAGSSFSAVPETAYRGTGHNMVGGIWAPNEVVAIRKNPGEDAIFNTVATTVAVVGGALHFGIGRYAEGAASDSTYADPVDIAALAFYAGRLTNNQVLSCYTGLQAAVLASGGLVI